jgi:hypothetical protein
MTTSELQAQREVLVQVEREHLLLAAEARGGIKLIDHWLAQRPADKPPAQDANDAHS